ncbi:MAG: hypothetical protein ABJP45_03905 [Cyclobacteriaceae bacterium]
MNNPDLLIVFGIIMVVAFSFSMYFKKKYKRPNDYKAFFIVGAALLAAGGASNNSLIPVGLIFMLVGLKNRSKWESNRFKWSDLSPEEKKVKIIFLSIVLLLSFGSLTYFLL